MRCFSLSLSLSLSLNFDLSSVKQEAALFCVEFPPKKKKREKGESFPHKKRRYNTKQLVKLNNVFVWKTFKRRGFEDRASVAEKKKKEHQRIIQFVFFVFFRSEEQYYCVRFVVRR